MPYVKLESPSFQVDTSGGKERITIRPKRNLLISAFIIFSLGGWTFGGLAAAYQLYDSVTTFIMVWLCAWLLGELYALTLIGWFVTGRETVAIVNGDLEIAYRIYGFTMRKLYRGSDIRSLPPTRSTELISLGVRPFLFCRENRVGSVHFAYGARTIHFGSDLDVEEGKMIVNLLSKRLPKQATSPIP